MLRFHYIGDDRRYDEVTELVEGSNEPFGVIMQSPTVDSVVPTGTIGGIPAEGIELSVDVDDADFPSDEVTVTFWAITDSGDVKIGTDTVSGDAFETQTASITWSEADQEGVYQWYAVAEDSYQFTANEPSNVSEFALTTTAPQLSTGSPSSGDIVEQGTVDLEINVEDPDFPDDEISLTWYEYENGDPATDTVLGTQTVTANGTYSTSWTPDDDISSWYVVAEDSYGNQRISSVYSFGIAGDLVIRDGTTGDLVDDRDIELRIVKPDGVITRTITGGRYDMSELADVDESIPIRIRSQDYYERTLELHSVVGDTTVYLERGSGWEAAPVDNDPSDTADAEDDEGKVVVRFEINDRTGSFTGEDTSLIVWGESEPNGEIGVIHSERFGSVNRVDVILDRDERYGLRIENQAGDSRGLGEFTATQSETVQLDIGSIHINLPNDRGWQFDAETLEDEDTGENTGLIKYADTTELTDSLQYRVYEQGNETAVVYETELTNAPITSHQQSVPLPDPEKNYVVEWEISRAGETHDGTVTLGGIAALDWPLSDEWLGAFGLFAIIGVAALFGGTMSRIGGVIIAVTAFAMTMIGILAIPYPFLMLAGIVALLFKVAEGGRFG